jgi:hypothetical protein
VLTHHEVPSNMKATMSLAAARRGVLFVSTSRSSLWKPRGASRALSTKFDDLERLQYKENILPVR